MNAIAKMGIQENIVKRIGTIVGQTLVIMAELVSTRWPTSIVLVLLDSEVNQTGYYEIFRTLDTLKHCGF